VCPRWAYKILEISPCEVLEIWLLVQLVV
jgi:hypothetical protein